VARALADLGVGPAEVSLVLTGDAAIRRLNRVYRGIDRPTDVLSFGQDGSPRGAVRLLGDVVISLATGRRQARAAGRPLEAELAMLAVHGLLHLLGHDHAKPGEARRMFALQNHLLGKGTGRVPV
jgi:probable rRNA maturation factor